MNSKAQLQIMENVFIIIIIFIILSIAFVFTIAVQKQGQRQRAAEQAALDVIKKSQVLNFLPELKCSDNNNINPDCYDILKIEAFMEVYEDEQFYYNTMLGNFKLEIVRFDPSPGVNEIVNEWVVFDNPKPQDRGYTQVQLPILLKDITEDSDHFGMIYLGVYR